MAAFVRDILVAARRRSIVQYSSNHGRCVQSLLTSRQDGIDAYMLTLASFSCAHRTGQCPCNANFCTRHGVIVSSLLHSRQKLGAGGVLEAGGSGTGEAVEPVT